ncbi:MAG: zinc ribbon domain-containing protein [Candidatus Bathyarchaeia archaeon]
MTILLLASTLAGFSSATSSTLAQVVTSYSYSKVPISTITWTSTVQQVLYSNSFPVAPAPTGRGCNIVDDTFTASPGLVVGTITTSYPVDFYLLSQAQYSTWSKTNLVTCDGPGDYMISALGISSDNSYTFKADLQTAGGYYVIFFNQDHTLAPNVAVTVMSAGTAETYTTTSDSLYFQTNLVTEGVSESSSQQQLPPIPPLLGQNSSILMLAIVAIIVVALGAIAVKKRRKTETRSVSKTAVVASDTMFCRKCGAKIPRDSTFCKECGEKTTKA